MFIIKYNSIIIVCDIYLVDTLFNFLIYHITYTNTPEWHIYIHTFIILFIICIHTYLLVLQIIYSGNTS